MDEKKTEEQPKYTYSPILRWLWQDRYLLAVVGVVFAAVILYKALFPATSIESSRLPKYDRVLSDFSALVDSLERARDEEVAKKRTGGVGAVNITAFKTKLYQIYDYMFVWEMREDSPFYESFPPGEKELIEHLQETGKLIDAALIRVFNSSGNPETPIDFGRIREELSKARELYLKETGKGW